MSYDSGENTGDWPEYIRIERLDYPPIDSRRPLAAADAFKKRRGRSGTGGGVFPDYFYHLAARMPEGRYSDGESG